MSSILPSSAFSPASTAAETRRTHVVLPKTEERDWNHPSKTDSGQSLSFSDFLSVINPLQHIPIIGSIYRAVTGDTVSPMSRVVGGMLFGGPVGLIASAFNAVIEQATGKDLGDQMLAQFAPDKGAPAPAQPPVQFADAAAPVPASVVEDATITPVSLSAPSTLPAQVAAAATGGHRTLGGSLYGATPSSATAPAGQGRTLSDYRNFTGRPLPIIDTNRSAGSTSAPVRLQPTGPLPERPRTDTSPVAKSAAPVAPVPTPADTNPTAGDSAAAVTPTDPSFVAAMARGLDRYREQRRIGSGAMQIDTTL